MKQNVSLLTLFFYMFEGKKKKQCLKMLPSLVFETIVKAYFV